MAWSKKGPFKEGNQVKLKSKFLDLSSFPTWWRNLPISKWNQKETYEQVLKRINTQTGAVISCHTNYHPRASGNSARVKFDHGIENIPPVWLELC